MQRKIIVFDDTKFERKINTLNRRIERHSLGDPITYQASAQYPLREDGHVYLVRDVILTLSGDYIVADGGWSLIGIIDHAESLALNVPGCDDDIREYVTRGPVCDHCGKLRRRSQTYIVRAIDDRILQVGRQCVGDLLGIDPAAVLAQWDIVREASDEDPSYSSHGTPDGYDLSGYLAYVSRSLRESDGYRKRGDGWGISTADDAANLMAAHDPITDDDRKLASNVSEWMQALNERDNLSGYLYNLAQIGTNGYVTLRSIGFAASAVPSYQREQGYILERKAREQAESASQHVGTIGQRLTLSAQYLSSASFDTDFGTTYWHKFASEGNIVSWRTTSKLDLEQGKELTLTGTVKDHTEYQGVAQTVMTRCKIA